MSNKRNILMFLLLCLVFPIASVQAKEIGFGVETIQPKTQIDKKETYFHVKTEPGKSQKLRLRITNHLDKPIVLQMSVANASTSPEGTIFYKKGQNKKDDTLVNSLEDITEFNDQPFILEGNKTVEKEVIVKAPIDHYDGIILGGVYVTRIDDEADTNVGASFSYRIAIILSESKDKIDNAKELKLIGVNPTVIRDRIAIEINLQNKDAKILRDLSVEAKIKDKKTGKVIQKESIKDGSMAPNSNFDWRIFLNQKFIEDGTYILEMNAKSDLNKWNFEEEFKVGLDKGLNRKENTPLEMVRNTLIIILIFSLVIVLGLYVYQKVLRKNKKHQIKF